MDRTHFKQRSDVHTADAATTPRVWAEGHAVTKVTATFSRFGRRAPTLDLRIRRSPQARGYEA
ncbi:hypothetical protein GLE_2307 [Lysobacter enzymogenes]|uniref:Uncharacterized protein n=1 Tax=Lysobacter enzymogenes TaxID=69 RepID=A0A0S2DH29_LYSEN|nr:hypothetical protein GLE_2307 [Lysobacter enzymogenes]